MYKIGFQNFRKFIDFNPIEYRGITLLVGRNNSGKSTIVKALLLINEYFKSGDFSKFHFGDRSIENANIVTFGRAKNASSNVNSIKFFYQFDKFQIDIHLTGNIDNTYANVISLGYFDSENSFKYQIKPIEGLFTYLVSLSSTKKTEIDLKIKNPIG
ncbi:MAG: AAA family ATPase [Saprospiraceae bacterium]|nr:AAA family ATPase [Candidatus Opimibacter skivensis]